MIIEDRLVLLLGPEEAHRHWEHIKHLRREQQFEYVAKLKELLTKNKKL